MLALGILELLRKEKEGKMDASLFDTVAGLAASLSGNRTKPEEFKEMFKKGDITINLPPIRKIDIDDNMAAYFITEEALLKSL